MTTHNPESVQPPVPDAAASPHIEAYVKAALAIQGYDFSEARIADVVQHFTRIEQLSRVVRDAAVPLETDSAPIFKP
jgi:hypothetical protein